MPVARSGRGDRDRVADDQGGQVDGELAAALGRGHQDIGVRRRPWGWRRQGSAVPVAVAFAESVMVLFAVLTDRIVVPAGMPVPVMLSPGTRPSELLTPVTVADPLVSVPVKTNAWSGPARIGMPGVGVDVAQRDVEVGDGDVGEITSLGDGAVRRAREEGPCRAVVERLIHARAVAQNCPRRRRARGESPAGVGGLKGI